MTKNQIIEALFKGKNFNDCIGKMEPEHLREDLKMEVALIVCEWPADKIIDLHERKELEFFVVRVILNQIQSNSSPFFKKYRRHQTAYIEEAFDGNSEDYNEAVRRHFMNIVAKIHGGLHESNEGMDERLAREEAEDKALSEIDGLYWYNAELIRLYVKHGNYRAIEKETGIHYISCYKAIQKSFKQLKQKVLQ